MTFFSPGARIISVDQHDSRMCHLGLFVFFPQIFLDQNFVSDPSPDTVATISLPSALHDHLLPGRSNTTRVQFSFYGTQELFQVFFCLFLASFLFVVAAAVFSFNE